METTQLASLIRDAAKNRCIILSRHCKERMAERRVSVEDILNVMMWGKIVEILPNPSPGRCKCRIKGIDLDGEELFFVTGVDVTNHQVVCITVF